MFSLFRLRNKMGGCSSQLATACSVFSSDCTMTESGNVIPRQDLLIPKHELLIPSTVTEIWPVSYTHLTLPTIYSV